MTLQEKIQFIEDVMEVDEGTLTTDTILERCGRVGLFKHISFNNGNEEKDIISL